MRLLGWLKRRLHSSVRIGPLYVSTWDWEQQHRVCCRPFEDPDEHA